MEKLTIFNNNLCECGYYRRNHCIALILQLRAVKEERERQVEDISRVQNDRILGVEQEKAQLRKEFTEQIIDQKVREN